MTALPAHRSSFLRTLLGVNAVIQFAVSTIVAEPVKKELESVTNQIGGGVFPVPAFPSEGFISL